MLAWRTSSPTPHKSSSAANDVKRIPAGATLINLDISVRPSSSAPSFTSEAEVALVVGAGLVLVNQLSSPRPDGHLFTNSHPHA